MKIGLIERIHSEVTGQKFISEVKKEIELKEERPSVKLKNEKLL